MELQYFFGRILASRFNLGFSRIRSGALSHLWFVQREDTNG
jgi:hypothetical protein